jgi:hypothetical protein
MDGTPKRTTLELPVDITTTWPFYDGMTREQFDELKARNALPQTIGSYDEVQELVRQAKAEMVYRSLPAHQLIYSRVLLQRSVRPRVRRCRR